MSLRSPRLVAPNYTPDGTVSWEETQPELARRIRDGDPNLGWLGDDRLSLHLNLTWVDPDPAKAGLPRWEVWRDHETVDPTLVASHVALRVGNGDGLVAMLAAHDSRTHDIASEVIAARDERERASKARSHEEFEHKADKLAWALARDLGEPAADGRIMPLSGR